MPTPLVLALRPSGEHGVEQSYLVYLVNRGERVERVVRDTGGYASDDDITIATSAPLDLGDVDHGEALLVAEEGPGTFDYTVWWDLELQFRSGERVRLSFAVPKRFPACRHHATWRHVPELGTGAWVLAPR